MSSENATITIFLVLLSFKPKITIKRSEIITGKIKLFGFSLTETSALLLFIFALSLVFVGVYGLYITIQTYNQLDYIAGGYLIVYSSILLLGLYTLSKTVRFRNKSN